MWSHWASYADEVQSHPATLVIATDCAFPEPPPSASRSAKWRSCRRWSLKFLLALRSYELIILFQLEPKLGEEEQIHLYWLWFYEEAAKAHVRGGKNKWKATWLRTKQPSRNVTVLKHYMTQCVASIFLSRKSYHNQGNHDCNPSSWGHLPWPGVSYFYNWLRLLGLQPLEDEYEINLTGSYYSLSSMMGIMRVLLDVK